MEDFLRSCVTLCAELTDTDPATYLAVGSPFGPELADLEDGQGGPRGEVVAPAEGALGVLLGTRGEKGPPDREVEVGGDAPRFG